MQFSFVIYFDDTEIEERLDPTEDCIKGRIKESDLRLLSLDIIGSGVKRKH